ncbi:MAG: hypothetical protein ABSG07_18355 [Terriglobales bacterium]|jgi:hypothetical protein
MASSSEFSSGVPQRRQMTAEQSRHVSGSPTSMAQTGQYNTAAGFLASAAAFGVSSMSLNFEHELCTNHARTMSTKL